MGSSMGHNAKGWMPFGQSEFQIANSETTRLVDSAIGESHKRGRYTRWDRTIRFISFGISCEMITPFSLLLQTEIAVLVPTEIRYLTSPLIIRIILKLGIPKLGMLSREL